MPAYQIHFLKDSQRQQFRWAPHTSGLTIAKPKDYEKGRTIEASTPYAVWLTLRGTPDELKVGDLLELEGSELRILKYIGFEEARWFMPEPVPSSGPPAGEVE
jgi:hypothetical protein